VTQESRLFVVLLPVEGGVDIKLTSRQPDEPSAIVVIRTVGLAPVPETTLHLPGAIVRDPA
jgi:hypothetical protein